MKTISLLVFAASVMALAHPVPPDFKRGITPPDFKRGITPPDFKRGITPPDFKRGVQVCTCICEPCVDTCVECTPPTGPGGIGKK